MVDEEPAAETKPEIPEEVKRVLIQKDEYQVLDNLEMAASLLRAYGAPKSVVATVIGLHGQLVQEYNAKYFPPDEKRDVA